MDKKTLQQQLIQLQQAIKAQEALRGILPAETIEAMLTELRSKEQIVVAQLAGSGATAQGDGAIAQGKGATAVSDRGVNIGGDMGAPLVTGDNNHISHIVTIYQQGGGRIADGRLRQAIADYAGWVMESYGRIPLRGLSDREYNLPDPNLPDVYVSLVAQQQEIDRFNHRPEAQREERPEPVDMRSLLGQGDRLVITGGPGSGKTTFLRHIAYLLAYAIYTGDETAVRQQLNLDGPIPLPIYLSLGDYYRYKQEKRDGTLVSFISYTLLQQHGVYDLPDDFFAQMLSAQRTVCLLLDSLDEIPDEDGRFHITHDVQNLAYNRSIRQMLVASRDHAYVGRVMFPASRFHRFIVQPMNETQIQALTQRWCVAVYPPKEAVSEARDLQAEIIALETIRKTQGENPLVNTPLMVTIVAIVHFNNRKLPQQRAALYEKCTNALLAEQHKGEEGQGRSQSFLEQRGGSADAKRGLLALLAFEMMAASPDKEAGRMVTTAQLTQWLLPQLVRTVGAEAAPTQLESFRRAMCDRASLLHERGGEHEFIHLTFQEFFCAYHLAANREPKAIAVFFQEEERVLQSWWREALLLTIGYLGKTAIDRGLDLVQLLLTTCPATAAGLAAAELAAAGLLELEAPAPDVRQQAHDRLVVLLADPALSAPPTLRAQAGTTLGRLGDRRPGVCTLEPDWVHLPGGVFPMGKERHPIAVEPFTIGRYLVTNAQFRFFMDAGGYEQPRYWTPEGWDYCQRQRWIKPRLWDDGQWNQPNQPVVAVSWYEAVAYTRWLTETLHAQKRLRSDWAVRLPTEAEWERAAAGLNGREYPWDGAWDQERANSKEAGVGRTTAVGVFPSGATPEGMQDVAGNVWEWCRTRYRDEQKNVYSPPYRVDDGREEMAGGDTVARVLKGGAYYVKLDTLRCAARYVSLPISRGDDLGFRVLASPSTAGL